MRIFQSLVLAAALAVSMGHAAAACSRCMPIENVTEQAVLVQAGKPITPDNVRDCIVRAGVALGWRIVEVGPGMMQGTLVLREHTAVIDIPYSDRSFSLIYRSSINLNEEAGQIHRNYNNWIRNLAKGINAQAAIL